jgi:serine/threonine protein kinase
MSFCTRSMCNSRSNAHSYCRYGTFQDEAKLYMVMEFVPGGELFGHLRAAGRFSVPAARFYVACVISALDHLHRHDIVYRC